MKKRYDKPFDCRWTNDKVFALGLWIGNKDTAEIVFTEQLAKIKSKGTLELLETPKTLTYWQGTCSEYFYSIQIMV